MRTEVTIPAEVRTSRGKNEARRTRVAGKIPAIVYGAFKDPVPVNVDPRAIRQIMRSATGYNTIFDLDIQGLEKAPVMLVDEQFDPVKGNLLHADFKRIDLSKRLRVAIPVLIVGEPTGVKIQGGLLELVNRTIEIDCLPNEIPANFTLDVVELAMGQSRRASDIPLTGTMKLVSAPESVIAHIVALRVEAEPVAVAAPEAVAAAPAAGEPEVIKKGKKEEEAEPEKGKKK